ncbi:MAG: Cobyrinic acid ac-diamide synthase [Verrucomicrobiales bacterium]|nr:Cobyrinic acid ac-diamide synthase [Verrucomicrobiales bacterium]
MRITFLNQKGGVGKSTVSILIGAALQSAGYRVAFDDQDPQQSIRLWASQVGGLPLLENSPENDIIICDTPGRLDLNQSSPLSQLIAISNRNILVCEKSLFSTHASVPMVEFVKRYQQPGARSCVLFNKVRSTTLVGKQNVSELSADLGLPALNNFLPLAAPFENVQTMGFNAVTGKHRELVLTLALEILKES